MNSTTRIQLLSILALCVALLSAPAISAASAFISLSESEKERVEQGEILVREVDSRQKAGTTFEAVGLINAPGKSVLQVLTEYESYPQYMPNVSRVEVVEQAGNMALLNYTLTLPLGKIKKYRLEVFVRQPGAQSSLLEWQLEEWPGLKAEETIKDTTGYWYIEERGEKSSLVLYHVYTDPGPIPFGLGWIVDVLSKNSIPEAFSRTKSRTEKKARMAVSMPEP